MPVDIIIGAQWGDEGKGRITDLLAGQSDAVARFSGGDNAGHTVAVKEETFKLHLIPSGIVHDGKLCIVGNGTVINPAVFLREIDALAERGVDVRPERLKISHRAHLITPAHIALDKAHEAQRGPEAIGTTQRGIGPAYTDKVSRNGLRAHLLTNTAVLTDALTHHINRHNKTLIAAGQEPVNLPQTLALFDGYAQRLAPYLDETAVLLEKALRKGQTVLAEGAQGTLLDIDHGTYPFVTSSSPTAGGAMTGLGLGPRSVGRIIGVAKAFTSRVGSGPFVTELDGDAAVRLRGTGTNPWDEYGTTTGRPRRVGWLDLVILRHAVRVNSLSELALTKLDILSGLDELPVCVAYELNGRRLEHFPADLDQIAQCQPIYETLPGWQEDVMQAREWGDLPLNAQNYIGFVAAQTNTRVTMASVGPKRAQVVMMD
jgi:adenylosuccinate synthase